MRTWPRPLRPWRTLILTVPELILLLLILAAVANIINTVVVDGYLPQPFILDTRDTFMDWYNTAYWSNMPGAYDVWRTVYPPLSFAFLKLFSTESCYLNDPLYVGRECDLYGRAMIFFFYALGMILTLIVLHRRDPRTGWIRALALSVSYPGLFLLERGNLIIPCYAAFVLGYGNILRDGWTKAVCIGLTINFKPYLLVPALALAVPRRWRMLELAGFATIGVYLFSYGVVGAGSILEIIANTFNWVDFTSGASLGDIYHTTTIKSYLDVVDRGFRALRYIDAHDLEVWLMIIRVALRSTQALAIVAIVGAWLQPKALTFQRVAALMLLLSMTQQSPGSYAGVFVLFLVFHEEWKRPFQIMALVAAYVFSIPYDYVFAGLPNSYSDSWLTGRAIVGHFGVGYGLLLRPAVLLLVLLSLSIDSIIQVVRAHRVHRPQLWLGRSAPLLAAA